MKTIPKHTCATALACPANDLSVALLSRLGPILGVPLSIYMGYVIRHSMMAPGFMGGAVSWFYFSVGVFATLAGLVLARRHRACDRLPF